MAFVKTLDILAKLKTRLAAIDSSPGVKAFNHVEYYSQPLLIQALQDLRLFKDRVCLIVPDDDRYENEVRGRVLITTVFRSVILLIADRDIGRRQDASIGDASTVGVIKLNQLVVDDLVGRSLDLAEVRVRPEAGGPVTIAGDDRSKATGREVWDIELSIEAGEVRTSIDP